MGARMGDEARRGGCGAVTSGEVGGALVDTVRWQVTQCQATS